jgi:hypothetical protein
MLQLAGFPETIQEVMKLNGEAAGFATEGLCPMKCSCLNVSGSKPTLPEFVRG